MFICKILLIADVIITSMAVAGRYISFIPDPAWSEQMVLTFMCYMAMLSATLAIRKRAHIRMTSFDQYLPDGLVKFSDLVADVAVFALG
ncbi:MAG: TRAP transporter small permease subunit, partial [Synergistaceae bacterium]|nr:TRAP transporter small permease subunit [Synergistaceae bacterium]